MKLRVLQAITVIMVTISIITSLALTGLGIWLVIELIKTLGGCY